MYLLIYQFTLNSCFLLYIVENLFWPPRLSFRLTAAAPLSGPGVPTVRLQLEERTTQRLRRCGIEAPPGPALPKHHSAPHNQDEEYIRHNR